MPSRRIARENELLLRPLGFIVIGRRKQGSLSAATKIGGKILGRPPPSPPNHGPRRGPDGAVLGSLASPSSIHTLVSTVRPSQLNPASHTTHHAHTACAMRSRPTTPSPRLALGALACLAALVELAGADATYKFVTEPTPTNFQGFFPDGPKTERINCASTESFSTWSKWAACCKTNEACGFISRCSAGVVTEPNGKTGTWCVPSPPPPISPPSSADIPTHRAAQQASQTATL